MTFGKRTPAGYGGYERRAERRLPTDLAGQIRLPTGQDIPRRVADCTTMGARIRVAAVFGLPQSFDLRAAGRAFHAQVVHRRSGTLGVRFV
jgi:hypothetical protein